MTTPAGVTAPLATNLLPSAVPLTVGAAAKDLSSREGNHEPHFPFMLEGTSLPLPFPSPPMPLPCLPAYPPPPSPPAPSPCLLLLVSALFQGDRSSSPSPHLLLHWWGTPGGSRQGGRMHLPAATVPGLVQSLCSLAGVGKTRTAQTPAAAQTLAAPGKGGRDEGSAYLL